jgi:type 1 glutamine amidotransferase
MMKLVSLLSVLLLAGSTSIVHAGDKKPPLRVCLISGSAEYESDKTLPILQKYLETHYDVVCTRAFAKSETDLPGLENLAKCDVAVLFTRRLKLEGEQLDLLKKYCTSGKPLVGIRTASHGIQTWLDIDKEVFGGNYKGHYKEGPLTEVNEPKEDKHHIILDGVGPFKSQGSLYKNTGLAKDADVLLYGSISGHTEPIAWTRTYKGARIFYTSLGHQKDFEEYYFLHLVSNAIFWTARQEEQIKAAHSRLMAALQTTCNLKCISLAMQSYNDAKGHLPPAYVLGADGKPAHSWRILLLEFLDPDLLKEYSFKEPWNGPNNRKLADKMPHSYRLAWGPNARGNLTSYVVLVGPKTAFPGDKVVKLKDITDGWDKTILVAEAEGFNIHWMEPRDWDVEAFPIKISDVKKPGFSSHNRRGPQIALADATIRRLKINAPVEQLIRMSTIAGGEEVNLKLVEADY